MPELLTQELLSGAWLQSAPLRKVFAALQSDGDEVRVVGGAVRNALLRRPVSDIDLATTARPEDVMRLARVAGLGAHPTGIDHGTVTVVADSNPYEVTTLRRDVETDGRHAVVAFTRNWEEDAARRDFTINALYCGADGTLYDFAGGLDDLRKRRVRFIGDPEQRIREDYLRILRFFRFSADFANGHVNTTGLAAAIALKDGVDRLSPERVRGELLKLLAAPKAADVVAIMDANGILPLIIGAHSDPNCLARLTAIEAALGQPPDAIARLAALSANSAAKAAELSDRLRLSNIESARLAAAATFEPAVDPARPEPAARAILYKLGADAFRRAARIAWARSGAPASDPGWRARALLPDRWKTPAMPFAGSDVVAMGVPEGPAVGHVLKSFERWWIAQDFPPEPGLQQEQLNRFVREELG